MVQGPGDNKCTFTLSSCKLQLAVSTKELCQACVYTNQDVTGVTQASDLHLPLWPPEQDDTSQYIMDLKSD